MEGAGGGLSDEGVGCSALVTISRAIFLVPKHSSRRRAPLSCASGNHLALAHEAEDRPHPNALMHHSRDFQLSARLPPPGDLEHHHSAGLRPHGSPPAPWGGTSEPPGPPMPQIFSLFGCRVPCPCEPPHPCPFSPMRSSLCPCCHPLRPFVCTLFPSSCFGSHHQPQSSALPNRRHLPPLPGACKGSGGAAADTFLHPLAAQRC